MFHARYQLLAARRAELLRDAQRQRQQLGVRAAQVDQSLVFVERGWKVWQFVRRCPLLVAAPVAAIAIFKPRALQLGLRAALAGWSMRHSVQRLLHRF